MDNTKSIIPKLFTTNGNSDVDLVLKEQDKLKKQFEKVIAAYDFGMKHNKFII